MLKFVGIIVSIIIILVVLFTSTSNTGLDSIGGKPRDFGFEPDIYTERDMYNKIVHETFVNVSKSNLYKLITTPIYVPQGTSVPLETGDISRESNTKCNNSTAHKNNPGSMFMFAYNKYSPSCCPSTYSTSSGCICMTDAQKKAIYNRGM